MDNSSVIEILIGLLLSKERTSISFPSWILLSSLYWLLGPPVTWHNSPILLGNYTHTFIFRFWPSECLAGPSVMNRLCGGLGEHQCLCKRTQEWAVLGSTGEIT